MIWLLAAIAFAIWRYVRSPLEHAFTTEIPNDLEVYLLGGQRVAEHQPLYAGDLMPGLPFTYPPFAGVLFSWLGEATTAKGIAWNVFSVVVLGAVIRMASRSSSPWLRTLILTAFFVICTEPVHSTLYFGQVNILLMALVCLDFLPRHRLPGIGTGLAAGFKLTPAFFIVLLALQKRWGAMFVAAFTFLCTVATGYANVPDAHDFWTRAIFDTSRVGVDDNPGALALRQVLHRLGADSTPLWLLLALLVTLLCAFASRRAPAPLALAFFGMTACLVSPFSWMHHWVWIVPFGVWIYERLGPIAFIALMSPYAAVNVLGPLGGTTRDLLFVGVPIIFMLVYPFARPGSNMRGGLLLSKKGTHREDPPHRRSRRGGNRHRPRTRRLG